MWDEDPLQTEVRQQRRLERLGDNPRCLICGFGQAEALKEAKGKVRQHVLEEHHVVGRKNDPDLTVILCLNHHRVETEKCRRAGVTLDAPPTDLHRTLAQLRALSAFHASLGESCRTSAITIENHIDRLDQEYPAWREKEDDT